MPPSASSFCYSSVVRGIRGRGPWPFVAADFDVLWLPLVTVKLKTHVFDLFQHGAQGKLLLAW